MFDLFNDDDVKQFKIIDNDIYIEIPAKFLLEGKKDRLVKVNKKFFGSLSRISKINRIVKLPYHIKIRFKDRSNNDIWILGRSDEFKKYSIDDLIKHFSEIIASDIIYFERMSKYYTDKKLWKLGEMEVVEIVDILTQEEMNNKYAKNKFDRVKKKWKDTVYFKYDKQLLDKLLKQTGKVEGDYEEYVEGEDEDIDEPESYKVIGETEKGDKIVWYPETKDITHISFNLFKSSLKSKILQPGTISIQPKDIHPDKIIITYYISKKDGKPYPRLAASYLSKRRREYIEAKYNKKIEDIEPFWEENFPYIDRTITMDLIPLKEALETVEKEIKRTSLDTLLKHAVKEHPIAIEKHTQVDIFIDETPEHERIKEKERRKKLLGG